MSRFTTLAKHLLGPRLTTAARVVRRGGDLPEWGNLRRTTPFSTQYGFERGVPIDRFYLHRFLETERACITGDVLEIQVSSYTRRYGHSLNRVHTLDIVPEFSPTYQCDLAEADRLVPANSYDCFLLPNVLAAVERLEPAMEQALRIVKPGGVILASVACLLPLTTADDDFWRLSPAGWRRLAARLWKGCDIDIQSHGNCLAVAAAAYGLAVEELTERELEIADERYPMLTTIKCVKPAM